MFVWFSRNFKINEIMSKYSAAATPNDVERNVGQTTSSPKQMGCPHINTSSRKSLRPNRSTQYRHCTFLTLSICSPSSRQARLAHNCKRYHYLLKQKQLINFLKFLQRYVTLLNRISQYWPSRYSMPTDEFGFATNASNKGWKAVCFNVMMTLFSRWTSVSSNSSENQRFLFKLWVPNKFIIFPHDQTSLDQYPRFHYCWAKSLWRSCCWKQGNFLSDPKHL